MGLQVGDVIHEKYRIAGLLGQGGMGAVFEGENLLIARRVAIKVLHGALASQQGVVERFEREAQAAGRIGNDHILEVLDFGRLPDGERFMVMEFLDGESLEQRIERSRRMEPAQLYPIVRQLLSGLMAAHGAGIIHRDLKPDNVFILRAKAGHADFVKIIDFGISKFTSLGSDMKMTATGAVMGTPYFMSPEQAKGSRDSDARSDLYAVGVILFKAITGQVPFDAATFNELLFKIVLSETPKASQLVPNLDPAFDEIIFRSMARDPSARFQSAREFVSALDNWYARGTAMLPSTSGNPLHAQLPTVAAHHPGSTGNFGQQQLPGNTPSPQSRGRQSNPPPQQPGFGHTPAPSYGQPRNSEQFGYQQTSGLNQETGYAPREGVVTHGTWSKTGLSPERSTRSALWLGAGAGTLLFGVATLGYMFWSSRQAPPAADEPPPAAVQVRAPEPPAVAPPLVQVTPPVAAPVVSVAFTAVAPPPAAVAPPAEAAEPAAQRNRRVRTAPPLPPPVQRPIEVARPIPPPEPLPPVVEPAPAPPTPRRRPADVGEDLGY